MYLKIETPKNVNFPFGAYIKLMAVGVLILLAL